MTLDMVQQEKEDNVKLGKALDLYTVSPIVGRGLPLLMPKGATIRRVLERWIVDEELKRGYQHVYTPILTKKKLFEISGHWPYYKDSMYPSFKAYGTELMIRPMSCPHHHQIFAARPRSYKELPLRLGELAPMARMEQSGELRGLIRVAHMVLNDAHIYCTREGWEKEFEDVLDFINYSLTALGLKKDCWFRLSLRDKSSKKYIGGNKEWDYIEDTLRKILKKKKVKFVEETGEAAFYGPKIDVQIKNVYGKEDTIFTNQVDLVIPKRFDLEYTDKDNKKKTPIVIHRSALGTFERTLGFLVEKYQGAFPFWFAPVQIKLLSFNDEIISYAKKIEQKFREAGFRVEGDYRSESVQTKVRDAEKFKIPYIVVIGQKEKEKNTIAVRPRGGKPKFGIKLNSFLKELKVENNPDKYK